MIKFLTKTAGVIALLILFMVFLKNPLETSVGIAVMGGWIGLMFTPHFRREMKKGLSFKESVRQVFKETLVDGSGDSSYQHNHNAFDNQQNSSSNNDVYYSPSYSYMSCNIHHNKIKY